MMTRAVHSLSGSGTPPRRGLTMLELLLSLAITAVVAMAVTGMLGAVSTGVESSRSARSVMILANAAASRLSAYISPSRCVLGVDGSNIALWFDDSRESNTVHASEIRWLAFDADSGEYSVHYVQFPSGWTKAACELEDHEYPATSNWNAVLAAYTASGWIATRALVDQLAAVDVTLDGNTAHSSRVVSIELGFDTDSGVAGVTVASSLTQHTIPN
jgi:prepilin-type N-terminal cleavage/methylation domain-containing protein